MSDLDVRTIRAEEIDDFAAARTVGFLMPAAEGSADLLRPLVDLDRTWGAFDGERMVGTLRSYATPLTVPGGGEVPAAALTNVTVRPTHRRRGLLRRMLEPDLRAAVDRGEVVGLLLASEHTIYGRYGYGPAADSVRFDVDTRGITVRAPAGGSVEIVDADALRAAVPAVYAAHRRAWPGAMGRDDRWWDRLLGLAAGSVPRTEAHFRALGRDAAGEVDAYAWYTVDDRWDDLRPDLTLEVEELVGASPAAEARLWAFLLAMDWVRTVKAGNRGADDPLPWLVSDPRAVRRRGRVDHLWLRVLDLPAALAARRYLAPGRVVLQVDDPLGLAGGRVVVEGGPDGASCAPTAAAADLTLPVEVLGCAYLGGTPLGVLAGAGLVEEHRAGALAVGDAMFRSPRAPWCATWF